MVFGRASADADEADVLQDMVWNCWMQHGEMRAVNELEHATRATGSMVRAYSLQPEDAAAARAAVEKDYQDKVEAMEAAAAARRKAQQVQQLSEGLALTSQLIDASDTLMQSRIDNADMATTAGRVQAEKAFQTQKRLAIVQVCNIAGGATRPPWRVAAAAASSI